jgi:hypothetical protein
MIYNPEVLGETDHQSKERSCKKPKAKNGPL